MNWRLIFWGISLQMIFAVFIFVVPAGSRVFLFINDLVVTLLESASAGTKFVFGRLALPPGTTNEAGETSLGFFSGISGFSDHSVFFCLDVYFIFF